MNGTDEFSRSVDEIVGLDRPGRIFVAPPGDDGGLANHAGGSFDSGPETVPPLALALT
jgi:hypothetical protein